MLRGGRGPVPGYVSLTGPQRAWGCSAGKRKESSPPPKAGEKQGATGTKNLGRWTGLGCYRLLLR